MSLKGLGLLLTSWEVTRIWPSTGMTWCCETATLLIGTGSFLTWGLRSEVKTKTRSTAGYVSMTSLTIGRLPVGFLEHTCVISFYFISLSECLSEQLAVGESRERCIRSQAGMGLGPWFKGIINLQSMLGIKEHGHTPFLCFALR